MNKYVAETPFARNRVGALAIYCSDGRYNEPFDEFIGKKLGLPNYDRMSIPGGPAWLIYDSRRLQEASVSRSHIEFLVEHHQLTRVILIAHENCGYYRKRLGCADEKEVERQQNEDMKKAKDQILPWHKSLTVDSYRAKVEGKQVTFTALS